MESPSRKHIGINDELPNLTSLVVTAMVNKMLSLGQAYHSLRKCGIILRERNKATQKKKAKQTNSKNQKGQKQEIGKLVLELKIISI